MHVKVYELHVVVTLCLFFCINRTVSGTYDVYMHVYALMCVRMYTLCYLTFSIAVHRYRSCSLDRLVLTYQVTSVLVYVSELGKELLYAIEILCFVSK